MNITILANRDIASNYAVNLLIAGLAGHSVTIYLSAKVGGSTKKPAALQRLGLYERALLEQATCGHNAAGAITPKSHAEQGSVRCQSFTQLSRLTTGPIVELNHINSPQGVAIIRAGQPDVILCIRFGVILQPQVIGLAKYGVLNLHSGLLPHYRGVMATFWALLNDEPNLGTTLHYINDKGIDTGDVVATTEQAVAKNSCYLAQVLQLYVAGSEQILRIIATIASGQRVTGISQPAGGNYYSFPDQNALDTFHHKGLFLIDETQIMTFMARHYD
jgi:methionyl-tRNA formyltransferase